MVTIGKLRRPLADRHTLAEPVCGLVAAVLDLRLGAAHLDLRTADLGGDLVELSGHHPLLSVDRMTRRVRARQGRSWLGAHHPRHVDVTLNERVEWSLDVRAPGMSGWLDLRRVRLGALQARASGARFHADLPAPVGPVHLRIDGRGVHATLSVPDGVVVRFWSKDGWQVDGQQGSRALPHDRYDVWLDGRGRCRVETRGSEARPGRRPALRVVS